MSKQPGSRYIKGQREPTRLGTGTSPPNRGNSMRIQCWLIIMPKALICILSILRKSVMTGWWLVYSCKKSRISHSQRVARQQLHMPPVRMSWRKSLGMRMRRTAETSSLHRMHMTSFLRTRTRMRTWMTLWTIQVEPSSSVTFKTPPRLRIMMAARLLRTIWGWESPNHALMNSITLNASSNSPIQGLSGATMSF